MSPWGFISLVWQIWEPEVWINHEAQDTRSEEAYQGYPKSLPSVLCFVHAVAPGVDLLGLGEGNCSCSGSAPGLAASLWGSFSRTQHWDAQLVHPAVRTLG